MKIISQYINGILREFKVYENYQEFHSSGKELSDLNNIKEGMYILFPNGIYVPIVSISAMKRTNGTYLLISLPRQIVGLKIKDKYNNPIERKLTREYNPNKQFEPKRFIASEDRYFALLLNKGLKVTTAYIAAYGNKQKRYMSMRIHKLFTSQLFTELIKKEELMESLKSIFENEGINEQFLAKHIKETIESGKDGPYKKKCLEIAIATISNNRQPKQYDSFNKLATLETDGKMMSSSNPLLAN